MSGVSAATVHELRGQPVSPPPTVSKRREAGEPARGGVGAARTAVPARRTCRSRLASREGAGAELQAARPGRRQAGGKHGAAATRRRGVRRGLLVVELGEAHRRAKRRGGRATRRRAPGYRLESATPAGAAAPGPSGAAGWDRAGRATLWNARSATGAARRGSPRLAVPRRSGRRRPGPPLGPGGIWIDRRARRNAPIRTPRPDHPRPFGRSSG